MPHDKIQSGAINIQDNELNERESEKAKKNKLGYQKKIQKCQ